MEMLPFGVFFIFSWFLVDVITEGLLPQMTQSVQMS